MGTFGLWHTTLIATLPVLGCIACLAAENLVVRSGSLFRQQQKIGAMRHNVPCPTPPITNNIGAHLGIITSRLWGPFFTGLRGALSIGIGRRISL